MWQPTSGRARRPEREVSHTQNRSCSYWPEIGYGSTWEQGLGSVPVLGDPLWLRSSHSVTGEAVVSSIGRNWRVQTGGGGHEVLLALEKGPVGTGNSRARCGRLWHLRDTSVAQAAAGSGRDIREAIFKQSGFPFCLFVCFVFFPLFQGNKWQEAEQ